MITAIVADMTVKATYETTYSTRAIARGGPSHRVSDISYHGVLSRSSFLGLLVHALLSLGFSFGLPP